MFSIVILPSEQKQYESALLQYKKIDVKNSVEDMFALAKVFYQLGKYQQCSKSNASFLFSFNSDVRGCFIQFNR